MAEVLLIAPLLSELHEVLSEEEETRLRYESGGPHVKADLLFEILSGKNNALEALLKACDKTGQTGAADTLRRYYVTIQDREGSICLKNSANKDITSSELAKKDESAKSLLYKDSKSNEGDKFQMPDEVVDSSTPSFLSKWKFAIFGVISVLLISIVAGVIAMAVLRKGAGNEDLRSSNLRSTAATGVENGKSNLESKFSVAEITPGSNDGVSRPISGYTSTMLMNKNNNGESTSMATPISNQLHTSSISPSDIIVSSTAFVNLPSSQTSLNSGKLTFATILLAGPARKEGVAQLISNLFGFNITMADMTSEAVGYGLGGVTRYEVVKPLSSETDCNYNYRLVIMDIPVFKRESKVATWVQDDSHLLATIKDFAEQCKSESFCNLFYLAFPIFPIAKTWKERRWTKLEEERLQTFLVSLSNFNKTSSMDISDEVLLFHGDGSEKEIIIENQIGKSILSVKSSPFHLNNMLPEQDSSHKSNFWVFLQEELSRRSSINASSILQNFAKGKGATVNGSSLHCCYRQ